MVTNYREMWRDVDGRFTSNGNGVQSQKVRAGKRGTLLTPELVEKLRKDYKAGLTIVELAKRYHVATGTVYRALRSGRNPIRLRPPGPVGSMDVPTSQIVELREVQNLSYKKIAEKVMLHPSTVQGRYQNYLKNRS